MGSHLTSAEFSHQRDWVAYIPNGYNQQRVSGVLQGIAPEAAERRSKSTRIDALRIKGKAHFGRVARAEVNASRTSTWTV